MKSPAQNRALVLMSVVVLAGFTFWLLQPNRLADAQPERPATSTSVAQLGGTSSVSADFSGFVAATVALNSPVALLRASAQPLFAYTQPADAAILDQALPAPARAIHYVRLNAALFTAKDSPFWQQPGAGRVAIPLPDGTKLGVVIDGTNSMGPDRFTSTGTIEGRPQSRVILSYNAGFLHASIQDVELGKFALRAATAELAQFYEIDETLVPPCGMITAPRPILDADAIAALARRKVAAAHIESAGAKDTGLIPPTAASAGANVTIDLMFLYTQAVLSTLSGTARTAAIQSFFDNATAKINSDFAASLITARVRLVKIAEVNLAGDELTGSVASWQTDALAALRSTTDGKIDEIHALRDQAGADLTCLILQRVDSTTAGLGYMLASPGENYNPLFGFSVVQYAYVTSQETVTHELGHNLGCAHDRENSKNSDGTQGTGAYSHSYGYRLVGRNQVTYRTIMAYAPGTRLAYFSNPNITAPAPISVPVGIASGQSGEAYNALTVEQSAFEVANYRLQTKTATNTGTLINVATRAFSGTGEQQLIAGFVIQGSVAKKMLVRASGPAIAASPFNVPNTIADPRITLYRTDRPLPAKIGENDNWGTPAGTASTGTQIAAASAAVGAFPFPSGGKDSALLTTLDPGSYTVNVESTDGGTGTTLVEAYEVDRNDNKVINLSTRGYADRSKTMIGGFVVQAGSGPTKRILIRVQGPSLAKYGLTAMDDPYLEIYNSAGDLVMKNDDWSTGSTRVNGVADDFRPTVSYFSEKQIYATGYAPGNRREPCVMADLAPGSYTVLVQPFESLPDQPAKPGVAIVEVYEINTK